MSAPEADQLKEQYCEAVRLHLWYQGSPYSHHRGKVSKGQAVTYLAHAHSLLKERKRRLTCS